MLEVAEQEARTRAGRAEGGAGEDEEAALLAGEVPVAPGPHVVDERPVVVGHDQADGADARVGHVGEREVNHAVAAQVRVSNLPSAS